MKASVIKTLEEVEDVNLALLTYKTTPLSHSLPSRLQSNTCIRVKEVKLKSKNPSRSLLQA